MNWCGFFVVVIGILILGAGAQAQSPPAQASQPSTETGIETPWDARKLLFELNSRNQQLKPLLETIDPQAWYDQKGASSAYISQWHTAQDQLKYAESSVQKLSLETESIAACLDAYFRMEALESTERSLLEGVRKYGERTVAEQLEQLIARNFNDRERFRTYMVDLSVNKEHLFKIADQEAQRCRGMISKEAPPPPKKSKSK
ncbi:MAG: hypothetical protein WBW33_03550 [Bryobacteraceae bacterium]